MYVQFSDVVVDVTEDEVTLYDHRLLVSSILHSVHKFTVNHCNTHYKNYKEICANAHAQLFICRQRKTLQYYCKTAKC